MLLQLLVWAVLAWNDAIKAVFKEVFDTTNAVGPMLIYAVMVTIIAVILTVVRIASKAKSLMRQKIFNATYVNLQQV